MRERDNLEQFFSSKKGSEESSFSDTSGAPGMYEVILLDDEQTPMDFVVSILSSFFYKDEDEAAEIMLQAHHKGEGFCGVYTKDVAETKCTVIMDFARANDFPLKFSVRRRDSDAF